jgi:hypothetical protein
VSESALSDVLHAEGPHATAGDGLFDQFVGTWACEYKHFADDGSLKERYPGHVTFAWILDGRALQDVWSGDRGDGEGERPVGTSIRFFDAKAARWIVVWILPEASVVTIVRGGAVDDRIVLEGTNTDGSRRRWSFNEIRPNSFTWRGEKSTDEGATWQLVAEYPMVRSGP